MGKKDKKGDLGLGLDVEGGQGKPAEPVVPVTSSKPVSLEPVRVPPMVEYQEPGGTSLWRISSFAELAAEFGVKPEQAAKFHATFSGTAKVWRILCRLYGIQPVVLPMTADPDEYGLLSSAEVAAKYAMTVAQLRQELESVRGAWTPQGREAAGTVVLKRESRPLQEEMLEGDKLLAEFRFSENMFRMEGHDEKDVRLEREWFIDRVRRWKKMLQHPQAGTLARMTLMDELLLYRMEAELFKLSPANENYKDLERRKDTLGNRYTERLKDLDKLNPFAEETKGAEKFRLSLAELIRGYQEYYSQKGNKLFDGFMTLAEVEVECRRCEQVPEPQYRAGIVVMVNAARAGLWDPNWKLAIPFKFLGRLDRTWKQALAQVCDEDGLPLVDLLDDGPGGEFAKLETLDEGEEG